MLRRGVCTVFLDKSMILPGATAVLALPDRHLHIAVNLHSLTYNYHYDSNQSRLTSNTAQKFEPRLKGMVSSGGVCCGLPEH